MKNAKEEYAKANPPPAVVPAEEIKEVNPLSEVKLAPVGTSKVK